MNKRKIYNVISIISTMGILSWMITDFWGGMTIYLFSYFGLIIIPIVLLYIISFIDTLISVINQGIKQNKIKVIFHGLVLIAIILMNLFQSDVLKSKRILTAILKDDLFHYTLIFRENGSCENEVSGIFGFKEVFHGKYTFDGDTIIFIQKPYDNDFLPDTLLLDRKEKAIFIKKNKIGKFNKTKEFLNHFEIQ